MQTVYDHLRGDGMDVSAALRVTRQLVMERLMTLDCDDTCSLGDVTASMTTLGEFALDIAFDASNLALQETHGVPLGPLGEPAQLCIVGMGKFGARELNVSSDIDLIYIYDHDGETSGSAEGRGRISNQEYFAKQVRAIYALIGDTTEHGFVFRVDLALRPNGNSGPAAVSLAALEEYFQVQGREWERFAWLKSRVVAPRAAIGSSCAQGLRSVVVPFVFRRYLDYNVFDALRVLHRQIRDHATKRSAGHPERGNDVKLSRGGIREIEFTVQLLQVVRGGQFPEMRTRPTLSALQRVTKSGLMPQATADRLAAAYVFLRQVEHRIQFLDDQQTHVLPTNDADLHWVAQTMGFAQTSDFLCALDTHREFVAQEFDALLGGAQPPCKGGCNKASAPNVSDFEVLLTHTQGKFRERLTSWQAHPRILALREESRARLGRLILRTAQWVAEGKVSEDAAVRLSDWIEPLLRRESYLALLLERPNVHERLLHMLGAAKWPARYLLQHPGVIDELAGSAMLEERFDAAAFEAEMESRRAALAASGEDDDEALLNLLRRAHHAEVFRTLARDVEGRITVEQVADDLSALADCMLRTTTRWCWQRLKNRHRDEHHFAIIAYGKLGGKELGYGSDLDIVFVYDDEDERATEVYGALVRKLINWLTVKTGEGDLYEIDTALRPNGNSGMLVTSFTSYTNYQQQRGSNTAWTWEHQAMTRARCVLGESGLHQRFDAVREAVISTPREDAGLRKEIMDMRAKVRSAHPVRGHQFDVKHSPGGMVDIEFVVQYLVLSQSAHHPELRANVGNIALLQRAQTCGLLPGHTGDNAAQAYRALRQIQHRARLNEEPTQVEEDQVRIEREAGLALWAAVFG
jgi:glutamate-ammonia-ligase adenylyltransferase